MSFVSRVKKLFTSRNDRRRRAELTRRRSRRFLLETLEDRRVFANEVYAGPGWNAEGDGVMDGDAYVWRGNDDGDYSDSVLVSYSVSGTATRGADYTLQEGTVEIPAGQMSVEIDFQIRQDLFPEQPETIIVTVTGAASSKGKSYEKMTWEGGIYDDDPQSESPAGLVNASEVNGHSGLSGDPIRVADGGVVISWNDLSSDANGVPWGVTRHWTNVKGFDTGNAFGKGTVIEEQPFVVQLSGTISLGVITNGHSSYLFDQSGSNYQARGFAEESLRYDTSAGEYIFTGKTGAEFRFYDFSSSLPNHQRGQFKAFRDPAGNQVTTIYDSRGFLSESRRSSTVGASTVVESLLYAYNTAGESAGQVGSVTLRRQENGGAWTTVRKAEYTYYDVASAHGNQFDIKSVVIRDAANAVLDTTYYRYYTQADVDSGAKGYVHGLNYVFDSASYARLVATHGANVDAVSNATAAPYAKHYYEYDAQQRVTKQTVQGFGSSSADGRGTWLYHYANSAFADGYNNWKTRTTETLPDGNKNLFYTNYVGEVMLQVFNDPDTDGAGPDMDQKWSTFYRFDNSGRVTLRAEPSAVSGYDETYADLVGFVANNAEYLRDANGLFEVFGYFASTSATTSSAGGVQGRISNTAIRQGETGTDLPQLTQDYIAHGVGATTVYLPANSTVYKSILGSGSLVTSQAYTYYPATLAIESQTATDPAGSVVKVFYDTYGRPVWTKDAAGYIAYTAYDQKSGAVIKTIQDVNTSLASHFIGLPSGWTTRSGAGLHRTTMYEVDDLGRVTKLTDAKGNITYTVYNDANREARVYPGWNTTTNTTTGPTIVVRDNRASSYTEVLTMSATPATTGGRPSGTEAIGSLQSLTRTLYSNGGQATETRDYFNLSGLTYTTSLSLGTLNTHYYSTQSAFDAAGRENRTVRGDGTIYRTVFDGLGRPTSDWVGTNDSGWNDAGGAAGMTQVKTYAYDNGGIGDSLPTGVTDALNRKVTYAYDVRGRLISIRTPDPDGSGSQPYSVFTTGMDNLDRTTSIADAYFKADSFSYNINTVAHTYYTIHTRIDPDGTGPRLSPLVTSTFDSRGLLIEERDRLNASKAYQYDGLGQLIRRTDPDPDGMGPLAAPETNYAYDSVGNLVTVTDPRNQVTTYAYDRSNRRTSEILPDPDGAGPLPAPATYFAYDTGGRLQSLTDPAGNVTTWDYDALGRVVSETNQLADSRSYEYDGASRLVEATDRLGRITRYEYNNLDQITHEKWYRADGTTLVRTIAFSYDAAGQLKTADEPSAARYDYTYDLMGRVTSETQDLAGLNDNIALASQYDKNSALTQLTATIGLAADFKNTYAYDDAGNLKSLVQAGVVGGNAVSAKRIDYGRNVRGQLDRISRYADSAAASLVVNSFLAYDHIGRLTQLTHTTATTAPTSGFGAGALAGYQFAYDAASRITSLNSLLDGQTSYAHDNTNQLTGADHTGQFDESYSYDENGNRTMAGYVATDNNQLTTDGIYTYTYDDEGNRLSKTTIATGEKQEFAWDWRNRLTGVTFKNAAGVTIKTVAYGYDAFNQLVQRTLDSDGPGPSVPSDTLYAYHDGQVALQFDGPVGQPTLTHRYLWNPEVVDQLLADEALSSGAVQWPLADHLGTLRDLAVHDSATHATTIASHRRYDDYGNLVSESNAAVDQLFGYTGKAIDESTGLQNNLHRWYDPKVGQWLSEDPVGFAGDDSNLRRYVANNPVSFTDPSGLASWGFLGTFGSDYGHYLTSSDGFLAGLGSGMTNLAYDTFIEPFRPESLKRLLSSLVNPDTYKQDEGLDWLNHPIQTAMEQGRRLNCQLENGLEWLSGKLSQPAGWGEAYVYASAAIVSGKIGAPAPISTLKGSGLRAATFGKNWQTASLEKAVMEHAGSKFSTWTTTTGKQIFENPTTGRQVVYDLQGRYFRVFQPTQIGGQNGTYLNLMGREVTPAMRVKGGAIKNVPLQSVDKGLWQAETHFLAQ